MVLLIIAGGVTGLVLGRFLRAFTLIPATMVIAVPAWYLGTQQGLATGLTAFVLSAVVMQAVYFATLLIRLVIQNLSVLDHVQSEASPPLPEIRAAFF